MTALALRECIASAIHDHASTSVLTPGEIADLALMAYAAEMRKQILFLAEKASELETAARKK